MSLTPLTPPPLAGPTPTGGPPIVITTPGSASGAQSSTTSSSSSSHASTTSISSSSSSQNGLSTGAQAGITFGIVFFLILSVLLFYNLKRRYQRARDKVDDEPALVTSEVSQYLPLHFVAPRERIPPPPPPPPPHLGGILRIRLQQDRYSTLSQATDPQRIATQDVPTLPNPHDPFSAPARPASHYSPTYSAPHDTSVTAATMATSDVPAVSSSSNSQSERQLSELYADMSRHQKELEFEHKKRSFEQAQELQEPPPQYPS
ncbi:uncharacterized protein BJ212DRAFT_1485508 [Suillus subaureus]|uniref:Uncharacterized protein n=1 Tax=Suillus subaureus TaxID=48587 RepID=A0A9P7E036_9AGAM|nr:uncharacterized protein BJ212DRAFT_1485508 [Suillus subaureus]KAG1807656.1 hypothetical protein BJ212DRAFT_1485508 [Suillus subaureus]